MTDSKYDRDHLCGDDVTPQEQELLVRLMEEAGEVVQACAKTLRWGWASVNPTLPVAEQETNRQYLQNEVRDLTTLASRLALHAPALVGDEADAELQRQEAEAANGSLDRIADILGVDRHERRIVLIEAVRRLAERPAPRLAEVKAAMKKYGRAYYLFSVRGNADEEQGLKDAEAALLALLGPAGGFIEYVPANGAGETNNA